MPYYIECFLEVHKKHGRGPVGAGGTTHTVLLG